MCRFQLSREFLSYTCLYSHNKSNAKRREVTIVVGEKELYFLSSRTNCRQLPFSYAGVFACQFILFSLRLLYVVDGLAAYFPNKAVGKSFLYNQPVKTASNRTMKEQHQMMAKEKKWNCGVALEINFFYSFILPLK